MSRQDRTPTSSETADDQIDLLSVVRVLWRARRAIAVTTTAAVLIGGVYAYVLAVPTYRATSVIMQESRQVAGMGMGLESVLGALSSDNATVNTEVEVLRGRRLMGRVVDQLDLTADPEFNSTLNPPSLLARLRGGAAEKPPEAIEAGVVSALLDSIQIRNVPNSLVFQISVTSLDPVKSARIADAVAQLYIDDQLQVRFDATSTATTWLTGQVAEQKAAFEAADAKVRGFRATTTVIDALTLAAMDRQVKDTRRRIEQIQTRIAEMDRAISASANPTEQAQLIGDRSRLVAQVDALTEAETALADDFSRQSEELTQLEQLIRDAEASRLLYEHFQTRLKETAAQQGINRADSRILSEAVIPSAAESPRKSLILMMSLILGAVVGAGFALLREMTANRIRSGGELEALTGHLVLSQIPKVPEKGRREVIGYLARHPASAPAEAIRNLRTALLLSSSTTPPKVIVLTSSLPGEGKTTTAVALAQNLTAMGKRVLLIEGDVRICTLDNYAPVAQQKPGPDQSIGALLEGKGMLADAVQKIDGIGDVIFGSKSRVNAADLFSAARFGEIVSEARAAYDIVLIDTPPVLVVPDVKIIAQHADGVAFVVRWDQTTREQVVEGLRQIASVRVPVLGLVLANIDPDGMKRYGYESSGAYYGSYGGNYYATES